MPFSIPARHKVALEQLIGLSSDELKLLNTAFESVQATDPQALVAEVSEKTGRPASSVKKLLDALVSMGMTSYLNDLDPDFFEDIATELADDSEQRFEPAILADELRTLMNASSVRGLWKGSALLRLNERFLERSRIVTDIRPVFDEEQKRIDAMTILHKLQLTYEEGDAEKLIEFGMTRGHLQRLKVVVDKALSKGRLVNELIDRIPSEFGRTEDDAPEN